jgi:ADP-heptose:LPS heptosyltransferase
MIDERWASAGRVLAIRLDNLGDVLVTTPAIHAIKGSLPGSAVTLLASPVGAQAGRLNPDVDDVIVYQAPWMDPWQRLPQDPERERAMMELLREREFDGAVIFSTVRQSPLPAAYLCYLAAIPLRVAASIDGPGSLLTTRHRHPDMLLHEVERGLDLVGSLGMTTDELDLVLSVPAEDASCARAMIADLRRNGPFVVLHPGCSMPARTYPWELYADVADLLIERLGATVALTGVEEERELVGRIAARMRHRPVELAGALSFEALCALIQGADLTITNNTGPMHIAAAVKTPVVALFALTNAPEQWGPWRVPHRQLYHDVPCRICYSRICPYENRCLRLVTPELVVQEAGQLLAEVTGAAEAPVAPLGAAQ